MKQPSLVAVLVLASASLALVSQTQTARPSGRGTSASGADIVEWTIPRLRDAMAGGQLTSRQIVQTYLTRIGLYDSRLHAVIAVNPRALELADERDRERAQGRIRG